MVHLLPAHLTAQDVKSDTELALDPTEHNSSWAPLEIADEWGYLHVVAVSEWAYPHRKMSYPYDIEKARLVFDCTYPTAWISFNYNGMHGIYRNRKRTSRIRARIDGVKQHLSLAPIIGPDDIWVLNSTHSRIWDGPQTFEVLRYYGNEEGWLRFKWDMSNAGKVMDYVCEQVVAEKDTPQWRIESTVDDWGDPAYRATSRWMLPRFYTPSPHHVPPPRARLIYDCLPSHSARVEFESSSREWVDPWGTSWPWAFNYRLKEKGAELGDWNKISSVPHASYFSFKYVRETFSLRSSWLTSSRFEVWARVKFPEPSKAEEHSRQLHNATVLADAVKGVASSMNNTDPFSAFGGVLETLSWATLEWEEAKKSENILLNRYVFDLSGAKEAISEICVYSESVIK